MTLKTKKIDDELLSNAYLAYAIAIDEQDHETVSYILRQKQFFKLQNTSKGHRGNFISQFHVTHSLRVCLRHKNYALAQEILACQLDTFFPAKTDNARIYSGMMVEFDNMATECMRALVKGGAQAPQIAATLELLSEGLVRYDSYYDYQNSRNLAMRMIARSKHPEREVHFYQNHLKWQENKIEFLQNRPRPEIDNKISCLNAHRETQAAKAARREAALNHKA